MPMKAYTSESMGTLSVSGTQGQNYEQRRLFTSRSLSGVITSHGDRKNPNGQAFTLNQSRQFTGTMYRYWAGYYTNFVGVMPYPFAYGHYDPGFDDNVRNAALEKMYEQLRGSVDLSVDAAQWRKMIQMVSLHRRMISFITGTARKLIPRVQRIDSIVYQLSTPDLRKKNRRRLRRELRQATEAMAKARLEFVYGWAPTVSTLQELAKGVLNHDGPGWIRCEGKATNKTERFYYNNSISESVPLQSRVIISQRCQAVCWFKPNPGVLDNLSRISSLNPISVAYEATPFSFVLDWAVNFSGFIRTLETALLHRNNFMKGFVTQTMRLKVDSKMSGVHWIEPDRFNSFAFNAEGMTTRKVRSGLSSPPFPTAPVKQMNFGSGRMLNALALAVVVFPKADGYVNMSRR